MEIRRAFNAGTVQVVNQPNLNENGGTVYTGALVGHTGKYGRYAFGTDGFFVRGTTFYRDDPECLTVDGFDPMVTMNGSEGSVTTHSPFGSMADLNFPWVKNIW
jgi:hypothetical protein